MEILAIEKRTVEQMMQRFEDFAKQINTLCGHNRSNENWLDNKQVCELLKICPCTLQTYRDTGVLPYSQIGGKSYYKAPRWNSLSIIHKPRNNDYGKRKF